MDVTVVVATFGADSWPKLAADRAVPSARALGVPVIQTHGDSLCAARNEGLLKVDTEWVVHLDADDELEAGYFEAMAAGTADVRAPSVRYIQGTTPGRARMPKVAGHDHDCEAACLPYGNWLVVGAASRAELLRQVGGWWQEKIYEDWSLWLRCQVAGATFEALPDAVYRAHVRPRSRNRALPMPERNRIHYDIVKSILGGVPA